MCACSKIKCQYTDVKSGCVTSVGPTLKPPKSQFKKNYHATVPFKSRETGDRGNETGDMRQETGDVRQ